MGPQFTVTMLHVPNRKWHIATTVEGDATVQEHIDLIVGLIKITALKSKMDSQSILNAVATEMAFTEPIPERKADERQQ
jgi:hypothetical protein